MDSFKPDEKNNVKIFNTVSKLVDALKVKLKDKKISNADEEILIMEKLEELRELKQLFVNENSIISLTACQGIASLVQCDLMSLKYALVIFQSSLVCEQNVRGISSAILSLLVLDLRAQISAGNTYKNPLPSHKQHPVCKLLIQSPSSWRNWLNQMASICYHNNKIVADHSLELLKPIFKFILKDWADAFSEPCRHQTWKLLVEKAVNKDRELIFQIISTRYFDSKFRCPLEIINDLSILYHMSRGDEQLRTALVPILASIVYDSLQAAYDPSLVLNMLKELLDSPDNSAHTVVLIMLSQSVTVCPAVFLHQILDFCEWLVKKGECNADSIWMLVTASLPWLNCVSPILAPAHRSVQNILAVAQTSMSSSNTTKNLVKNPFLTYIVSSNWEISFAIQLARLCESLRTEVDASLKWLSNVPTDMISKVYLLIGALMIGRNEIDVKLKAIDVIKNAPPCFASHNLTLILYQLGREKEPDGQLALLRALTSTAVDKSNISSIIFTLKTLQKSNEPHLQILAVDLFLRLWNIEERCYPFLLTTLTEEREKFDNPKFSTQMDIACAAGFRFICEKMPEKHGKELVKPIQNLLIKCQGKNGAIASSFLIQALALLVEARVLSASSTWKQLYPLTEDMQTAVCASFCQLVEACVQQNCDDVINSMCSWLWKLITTYKATFVVNAALRALKKFSVQLMKLKLIPANYRKNIILPAQYAKKPGFTGCKPEDVLDYVPGSVWVELLQNLKPECQDSACDLLAHWIEVELSKYRGGVYDTTFGEHQNYNKLPEHSVCRGLVDYLRRLSESVSPETDMKTVKLIFKIISVDRSKPLPPIDWSFIAPFIQHPDVKFQALTVMAKQSKGSLSARAAIESYINEDPHNSEKELFLYSLLSDLARGVPPKTLQNLIGRTLRQAFKEKDDESVRLYLQFIRKTLEENDIHEANKTMFSQNLEAMFENILPNSNVLDDLLLCTSNLAIDRIETLSSTSVMWEITTEKLQKAIKLRCKMAVADNAETPFTWLNECIEAVIEHISEQILVINEVEEVLKKRMDHKSAQDWLLELVGKMYQTAACKEEGLDFMFSVFILAVDYISKFSILFNKRSLEESLFRFPHALSTLLSEENGDIKKVRDQMKVILKSGMLDKDNTILLKHGMAFMM